MKTTVTAFAITALASFPLSQAVAYDGGESDNTYIEVGVSTVNIPGGTHTSGLAGIGVYTSGIGNKVDFEGLANYQPVDGNDIHNINAPIDVSQPDHRGLGVFSFAQVGDQDVWFGEWSQDGSTSFSNRAVYYYGDTADTTIPTTGTDVHYSVQGISRYTGSNDLDGDFYATFTGSGGTLTGSIANSALTVNVGSATFNSAGEISSSNATATHGGGVSNGSVEGRFYGANAAGLAGIATFNDSQYDTAFGGTR
ncbi:MAG: hypothetical protein CL549_04380 [Alcanivorax sp.]|nr:hypothetical protein [Alcanivorax sp.]